VSRKNLRKSKRYETNVISFNEYTPRRERKKKVEIIPRNLSQEDYLFSIEDYTITFGIGPAGTGKTLIATLMAIQALKDGIINRIVITRPAVSVDEQHGFLPGTLVEKMAPWTRPIFDVFEEYYTPKQLESMIEDGVIEIAPLAYMRGRTFSNSFIIFDEAQNCTSSQMKMVLTRIGQESKIVITGDLEQHDRGYDDNGLKEFIEKSINSSNIKIIKFQNDDVERNKVVEEILSIYNNS